jgi:hypothetical protein
MRHRVLNALAAIVAGVLLTGGAQAAEGQAVGVNPDAFARLSGQDRILTVGSDVSLGERIVTGESGQVQIVFADETKLVVGPGSELLIEAYLMTGSEKDKFAINALAGSFRFLSGNGPKAAYSIKTPTASIAIRGTQFDFNVVGGRTDLMLYDGGVEMCAGKTCTEVKSRCDIASVDGSGVKALGHADTEHNSIGQQFNFARFPSLMQGAFRVGGAGKCAQPLSDEIAQSIQSMSGSEPVVRIAPDPGSVQ